MKIRIASLLVIALALFGSGRVQGGAGAWPPCDEICTVEVDCTTICAGNFPEEPAMNTCGNHYGGAAEGYCTGPAQPPPPIVQRFRFPEDGLPWAERYQNYPDQHEVGDCFGNCGPGCDQYMAIDICKPGEQYWELTFSNAPNLSETRHDQCHCFSSDGTLDCGTVDVYTAEGTWTYHGWMADGCHFHDQECRDEWWFDVIAWIFIGLNGFDRSDFLYGLAAGFPTCKLDWAIFLEGGACLHLRDQEWPYQKAVQANVFTHEYYTQAPMPGQCYDGPAICGDGICQSSFCQLLPDQPGMGCEENADNCSEDCGGNQSGSQP